MSCDVETSQAEPDLKALEDFLVGNQDLERLEALLDRFPKVAGSSPVGHPL